MSRERVQKIEIRAHFSDLQGSSEAEAFPRRAQRCIDLAREKIMGGRTGASPLAR